MRSRAARTRLSKRQSELMKRPVFDDKSFDFDIGYLVKSPCKGCMSHHSFPDCMDGCELLDRVQSALSDSISSVHSFSAAESFDVPLEVLEQI